jgi:hypothetical protein
MEMSPMRAEIQRAKDVSLGVCGHDATPRAGGVSPLAL